MAITGMWLTAAPAHAFDVICPIEGCSGEGGGGGGGGDPITYTLQGVIQNEGYEYESNGPGKRVKIRGYSRFADPSNDRVDADYINVRCYAYDPLGGNTTKYDSENGGALVDVKFESNPVYGVGGYRRITVTCTHYAEMNGVQYNTTSNAVIDIP